MTLSMFLILYIVGMVVTFALAPIVAEINKSDALLAAGFFFPLFWAVTIFIYIHVGLNVLAQWYIDFLEKRNEK